MVQIHLSLKSQLGTIARIKRRSAIRKRHQNKHLDLTIPAFEAEGREFESLRARHLKPIPILGYAAFSESGSQFPAISFLGTYPRIGGAVWDVFLTWRVYGDLAHSDA